MVNTSHPGNIGSAARAMKTMGFNSLTLVNPKIFPHDKAVMMAAGAKDVLNNVKISPSLAEAVAHDQIVFGTSARLRKLQLPLVSPRQAASIISQKIENHLVSIVFGQENNGLARDELALCTHQICIPANPEYSSLNLASAVQLICYEIKIALDDKTGNFVSLSTSYDLAPVNEISSFYDHLQEILTKIKFFHHHNDSGLMAKLKLIFARSQLRRSEVKILRGILTTISQAVNGK